MAGKTLNIARAFLALGIAGVIDAGYLTYLHFSAATPYCSVFNHCDIVLTSPYAVFIGVPVALIGFIYYVCIAELSATALAKGDAVLLKWAGAIATLGFAAYLWFIFVQAFILHSFCIYCLLSAAITTALFVLFLILAKRPRPTV